MSALGGGGGRTAPLKGGLVVSTWALRGSASGGALFAMVVPSKQPRNRYLYGLRAWR